MGKIQHIVPKWYLRNFSPDKDKGFIHIFEKNTKSQKFDPINKTAAKDNFYGEDGVFEELLNPFETRTSEVVRNIIASEKVQNLNEKQFNSLLEFVLLQSCRTESAQEITDKFLEVKKYRDTIPSIKRQNESISKEMIDSIFDSEPDYHKWNMKMEMKSGEAISDLSPYLIKNVTKIPFITSDDPVVINNYYLMKKHELIGLCSLGLQIICPLTCELALLLVHKEAYKVNSDNQSTIVVNVENDINFLNQLQMLNCYQQVFLKKDDFAYLQKLSDDSEKMRNKELQRINHLTNCAFFSVDKPNLLQEYNDVEKMNYHIHFSFLKLNHGFNKKYKSKFVKNNPKSQIPIRDPKRFTESQKMADSYIPSVLDEYKSNLEHKYSSDATQRDKTSI
jgi:hypothetical protein